MSLGPGESKRLIFTVFIPSTAMADVTYDVIVSAVSQTDPNIKSVSKVQTQILSLSKVKLIAPTTKKMAYAEQTIRYKFGVINLGNKKDVIELSGKSIFGEKVNFSQRRVELDVREKSEIELTVTLSKNVTSNTKHFIIVKAVSKTAAKEVFDKIEIHTDILDEIKVKPLHRTLDAELTMHVSGFGTDDPLAPQVELEIEGALDQGQWVDFQYEGPRFENRANYKGVAQENIRFEFGNNGFDLTLGDTSSNLASLLMSSPSGRGIKLHYKTKDKKVDTMLFNLEKQKSDVNLLGGKITKQLGFVTKASLSFLQEDKNRNSPNSSRELERKKISSFCLENKWERFSSKAEFAHSYFEHNDNPKRDSGAKIETRYKSADKKFAMDFDYSLSGADFAGSLSDTKGYRSYLRYRLWRPLELWYAGTKQHNNVNRDPSRSRVYTDNNEIGASIITSLFSQLSISFKMNSSEEKQESIKSLADEDGYNIRVQKTIASFLCSFNTSKTEKKNSIKSTRSKTRSYNGRISKNWKDFNFWLNYNSDMNLDVRNSDKAIRTKKEFGMRHKINPRLKYDFKVSHANREGGDSTDIIEFDIDYEINDGEIFTLEGEINDTLEQEKDKKWRLWLTYNKKFDVLVPWLKIRGILKGKVFIDENGNGLLDKIEDGAGDIVLILDEDDIIKTDKNGYYEFPPIDVGDHTLNLDPLSIAMELGVPNLPIEFDIVKGQTMVINIPLVETFKIMGTVFYDTNKNKKQEDGEGGMASIKISLFKDSVLIYETLSNQEGTYSFGNVVPGRYKVMLNKPWLPKRHRVTTPVDYFVSLEEEEKVVRFDFGVNEDVPIKITYSSE